jgi:hypothetical protein
MILKTAEPPGPYHTGMTLHDVDGIRFILPDRNLHGKDGRFLKHAQPFTVDEQHAQAKIFHALFAALRSLYGTHGLVEGSLNGEWAKYSNTGYDETSCIFVAKARSVSQRIQQRIMGSQKKILGSGIVRDLIEDGQLCDLDSMWGTAESFDLTMPLFGLAAEQSSVSLVTLEDMPTIQDLTTILVTAEKTAKQMLAAAGLRTSGEDYDNFVSLADMLDEDARQEIECSLGWLAVENDWLATCINMVANGVTYELAQLMVMTDNYPASQSKLQPFIGVPFEWILSMARGGVEESGIVEVFD